MLKVPILFFCLSLAIVSSFIIQKVYVPIFTLIGFLALIKKDSLGIVSQLLILIFFWNCIVFVFNLQTANAVQFTKVVISCAFFIGVYEYIRNSSLEKLKLVNSIYWVLVIVLVFNSAHIFININKADLWSLPFGGSMSSSAAYKIQEVGIYFGSPNKNIWATKVLFIFIFYSSILLLKLRKVSALDLILIPVFVLAIIYGLSRTSQVGLILFLMVGFLVKFSHFERVKWFLYIAVFPLLAAALIFYALNNIHFSFDETDGFFSRVILWTSIKDIESLDLIAGSGHGYGAIHIPIFTPLINDNFHNVFVNQLVDSGVVGLLLYVGVYISLYVKIKKSTSFTIANLFFIPLMGVVNSHYTGFDNDVFIYLGLSFLLSEMYREKMLKHSN